MAGRQAHGRSLLGNKQSSKKKPKGQKSKSKARAHALDAFAIAAKQIEPERVSRRGRTLELDPERQSRGGGGKHRRDEDEGEESEEDEDDAPRKKRAKQSAFDEEDDEAGEGSDVEGGSDSDGNKWHVGVDGDDDDSELDSDEAFGESDDEKFEGYAFRGSRSQREKADSEDEGGDDGASLGSDAIDLADALDQSSDDDDEEEGSAGDTESGSEEEETDIESDDEDDDIDPSKLGKLQNIIKGFAGTEENAEEDLGPSSKQTISLEDLGLSGVKDPSIRKSVKLMEKEAKAEATKQGLSKKLDVPLPRRQQAELLRAAAYEKTTETLDRWNETVKHNRRADHLVFPLAHTLPDAGLDNGELVPLTQKTAGSELEQTILSIMEESGLGPSAKSKQPPKEKTDVNGEEQSISRADLKELWAERRRERELQSREQSRAKRIKKIKSKTYRKIHRKERLGDEADQLEQMRANGEIDSEEEREAAHRRRALERVGAKHKESKWAKMGSKVGRAVWDDDYRAGLTDMARRNEELRRRVEGNAVGGGNEDDESDGASASGDEDENAGLLKQLEAVDDASDDDDHPHAKLMKLAFMQKAEARQKKANDELVAQIRRDLASGSEEEDDDAELQVGRRKFGMGQDKKIAEQDDEPSTPSNRAISNGAKRRTTAQASKTSNIDVSATTAEGLSASGSAGVWGSTRTSAVADRKKGRKAASSADVAELDLNGAVQLASKPAPAPKPPKVKTNSNSGAGPVATIAHDDDDDDASDDGIHLPLAIRDHELVSRAFGGDDVVAEFREEKEAIMSEDDEKVIDETMPGWGSWTGEGISKRAQKRNKGKVLTKKDGIKKKDRKDAKLEKVIINEKRNRKVCSATHSNLVWWWSVSMLT